MTEKKLKKPTSPRFSLNGYDYWSVIVYALLLGAATAVTYLIDWAAVNLTQEHLGAAAPIVLMVVNAGLMALRKYIKDYSDDYKPGDEAEGDSPETPSVMSTFPPANRPSPQQRTMWD